MSSLDIVPREESERRLAAILVADVVGYSRLMQADEGGTLSSRDSELTFRSIAITSFAGCRYRRSCGRLPK